MKRSIEEIDVLIREALGQADAELLDQFGGQSLPEMVTDVFRRRHRLLGAASLLVGIVFIGLSIVCVDRFLGATEIRQMLLWGAGAFFGISVIWAMKVWFWMEMNRNALAREIKRLELQVAQLAKTLRTGTSGAK